MTWTQPLCEACWVGEQAVFTPDGEIIGLKRLPYRVSGESELFQCCECGKPTFVGVFVRRDPSVVPFPREDPEDAA